MKGRWLGIVLAIATGLWSASAAQAADVNAIGSQLRLTQIGPDGNIAFYARAPTIAYNSLDDEFLVAWVGRDPTVPGEDEIYGRVLDGTGVPKGAVRRLSAVSGATAPAQPVLGYSPSVNQYLLAYTAPPLAAPNNPVGQREVMAQVVSATGAPSGNAERISNTDTGERRRRPSAGSSHCVRPRA